MLFCYMKLKQVGRFASLNNNIYIATADPTHLNIDHDGGQHMWVLNTFLITNSILAFNTKHAKDKM